MLVIEWNPFEMRNMKGGGWQGELGTQRGNLGERCVSVMNGVLGRLGVGDGGAKKFPGTPHEIDVEDLLNWWMLSHVM